MATLSGKVALVTGGSRGIGRAIAARLAAEGAAVAVHYNANEGPARELVGEIRAAGGKAVAVGADLASVEAIGGLFDTLDRELTALTGSNRIDILVNNAGVAEFLAFEATDEPAFDRLFDVNVKGLFFVTQRALGRLPDGGRVINISSVVARAFFPGIPAYSATKGAVDTLTVHLAATLGARGITVNSVSPGAIDTDMSAWLRTPEGEATARAMQAIPRTGKPDDIAALVAFLATDEAGWVTGQVIEAGGGTKL